VPRERAPASVFGFVATPGPVEVREERLSQVLAAARSGAAGPGDLPGSR